MADNYHRHSFPDRDLLADALATTIAAALSEAIEKRGHALLAVSGGTTPGLMFETLSRADIAWDRVTVTLVDDRFVPPASDRSNAKLVRDRLLTNAAASAKFIPLYSAAPSVEEAAGAADAALNRLELPFDVVVLGMGKDGHTASFFPDAAELEEVLDAATQRRVDAVNAASAGEPRLTLTLPPIASARLLLLHIEGGDKNITLDQVLADGSMLPMRRVIDAAMTPVEIFWAA